MLYTLLYTYVGILREVYVTPLPKPHHLGIILIA